MNIYVEINDETISKAASLVMKHYRDAEFLRRIENVTKFNYTSHTSKQVAQEINLSMANLNINIVPYTTKLPWSKTIGYAVGNTIFVNTRKLDLPLYDRAANFLHEPLHLIGYQHSGNKATAFNLRTVPYLASAIFAKYLQEIYG